MAFFVSESGAHTPMFLGCAAKLFLVIVWLVGCLISLGWLRFKLLANGGLMGMPMALDTAGAETLCIHRVSKISAAISV